MPDYDRHLHAGELLADRARLLGIAGIVADFELDLLAEHAARGVDVGDGLFGAVPQLAAERGFAARHRAGNADANVLSKSRSGNRQSESQTGEQRFLHLITPSATSAAGNSGGARA